MKWNLTIEEDEVINVNKIINFLNNRKKAKIKLLTEDPN